MFSMIADFFSKQWMPVALLGVSLLIILIIIISNGERIMSVFGYETRDTVVEKLKQRDEQLNLLAATNAKLTNDINEARLYERSQCETRIAGIMAEIEAKRKSQEITDKAEAATNIILDEIEVRLAQEEKKPVAQTKTTTQTKPNVKKHKRVIQDSDLTREERDKLSMVNIAMIHEAYTAIGVSL